MLIFLALIILLLFPNQISSSSLRCNTPSEILLCQEVCDKHNGQLKVDHRRSPFCECKTGFEPDFPSQSCVDIDECALGLDNCPIGISLCRNTVGGYYCDCFENAGWKTSYTDPTQCENMNECASGRSLCGTKKCCRDLPPPSLVYSASRGYVCLEPLGINEADGSILCPEGSSPPQLEVLSGNQFTANTPWHDTFQTKLPPARAEPLVPLTSELSSLLRPTFILSLIEQSQLGFERALQPVLESSLTPALATWIAVRSQIMATNRDQIASERERKRAEKTTNSTSTTAAPRIKSKTAKTSNATTDRTATDRTATDRTATDRTSKKKKNAASTPTPPANAIVRGQSVQPTTPRPSAAVRLNHANDDYEPIHIRSWSPSDDRGSTMRSTTASKSLLDVDGLNENELLALLKHMSSSDDGQKNSQPAPTIFLA